MVLHDGSEHLEVRVCGISCLILASFIIQINSNSPSLVTVITRASQGVQQNDAPLGFFLLSTELSVTLGAYRYKIH